MSATDLKRTLDLPWSEAREAVIAALKTEGFGVLTEIDVKATMKAKLDVDFRPYAILGACNPTLAHKALTAMPDIGVMLPCNVAVYEEGTQTVVAAVDPRGTIARIDGPPELAELAEDVRARLERVLEKLN